MRIGSLNCRRLLTAVVLSLCLAGTTASVAFAKLPRMNPPAAKQFIGKALKRGDDELNWRYADQKRISHCKRIARPRMRCAVKWRLQSASIPRYIYKGHVTVWYSRKRGTLYWNYAYDIRGIDRECQATPGARNCVRHWHVDRLGRAAGQSVRQAK